ncbi:MAG: hypothetical protein R3282_08395, partial [Rhodothermales bacterium]|nr:hypothetical protein [Rhodothermales bacterium]
MSHAGAPVLNAVAGTGSQRGLTVVGVLEKPFSAELLLGILKRCEKLEPVPTLTSEHVRELRDEGLL